MLRGVDRLVHRWLGHVIGRGWITWEMIACGSTLASLKRRTH